MTVSSGLCVVWLLALPAAWPGSDARGRGMRERERQLYMNM